jgi:hypothetical protein
MKPSLLALMLMVCVAATIGEAVTGWSALGMHNDGAALLAFALMLPGLLLIVTLLSAMRKQTRPAIVPATAAAAMILLIQLTAILLR